jgi:hypothetical protein
LHIENCNICKSSNTYHIRHEQAIPSLAPKKNRRLNQANNARKESGIQKPCLLLCMDSNQRRRRRLKGFKIRRRRRR